MVLAVLTVLAAAACAPQGAAPAPETDTASSASTDTPALAPAPESPAGKESGDDLRGGTEASLLRAAEEVAAALARRDMVALASHVHPDRGLTLSPYAYVDQPQVLERDELPALWESDETRLWGTADGTGEPIEMSLPKYIERYVYDVPFAEAPEVAVDRRLGQGNTLSNLEEAFPGSRFVELHFPGFEERYEGMDWRSLRLVFQPAETDAAGAAPETGWWLVGLVHDEWTI